MAKARALLTALFRLGEIGPNGFGDPKALQWEELGLGPPPPSQGRRLQVFLRGTDGSISRDGCQV